MSTHHTHHCYCFFSFFYICFRCLNREHKIMIQRSRYRIIFWVFFLVSTVLSSQRPTLLEMWPKNIVGHLKRDKSTKNSGTKSSCWGRIWSRSWPPNVASTKENMSLERVRNCTFTKIIKHQNARIAVKEEEEKSTDRKKAPV